MGCGSSSSAAAPEGQQPQQQQQRQEQPQEQQKQQTKSTPAKSSSNEGVGEFLKEGLEAHNRLRQPHQAPTMTLADDLNVYAQKWADNLAARDTMEHSNCKLPSGGSVGENLYMCWSSDPKAGVKASDAVQSWYDEIKDYDFSKPDFAMDTGHFTQVVWKGSTELGMAWAKAKGGSIYVVASYRPAGNMMGDFENHVLPK
ncbi:Golgi-associated plant pathogenesis-related protein 1-like [Mya arenaria]|uniref:Golgi-associated plant pathogenesis-related protein 1-like n=1 Tax=Mya arenaria TaxID=6604 RepID=UPI0022E6F2FA|nr:Golgi-associated plant pathogenesis-related protein 1-like [Mya arenaria]